MAKLPYMTFYTGDWLKDPALSLCSPATRGVWMDLLSRMHEAGRVGSLSGTREQLARLARCVPADLVLALDDLQTTGAADVTERNGVVTVTNRRLSREAKEREANALRQSRHRALRSSDGGVTPPLSSSYSEPKNPPPPKVQPSMAVDAATRRALEEEVFECGVSDAVKAVRLAIEAGCTAAEIRAVIASWAKRGGELGPGSLHGRLCFLRPGANPSEGWPPPPAAVVAKTAAAKRQDREREEEEANAKRVAESNATAALRERRYGPELDEMPPEEVAELCKGNTFMAKQLRSGKQSDDLRAFLLRELERRSTP